MPFGVAHLNTTFRRFHFVALIAFFELVQRLLGAYV
jgi:hypothetical protein